MDKPYYKTSNGSLHCNDCTQLMGEIPDNIIDLTITSPPYDNLRDYHGYSFDFKGVAKGLYRVTKEGGVVVWIVGDSVVNGSKTGTSFTQALFFKKIGFFLHDVMIYKKQSPFPMKTRYYPCFEYMFILSKEKPKTTNLIADQKRICAGKKWGINTVRQKDGTMKEKRPKPTKEYGVRSSIWEYAAGYMHSAKDKIAYEHPAIFPEMLAQDHILSWSNEKDMVFDPMAGSGTVAKMCERLNRKWLACEISEKYCKIAVQRIKIENSQLKLFT